MVVKNAKTKSILSVSTAAALMTAGALSFGSIGCGNNDRIYGCGDEIDGVNTSGVTQAFFSAYDGDDVETYWTCEVEKIDDELPGELQLNNFLFFMLADGTGSSEGIGEVLEWEAGEECGELSVTSSDENFGTFIIRDIEVEGDDLEEASFNMAGDFNFGEGGTANAMEVTCVKQEFVEE